jgi:hypothetical protein
MDITSTLLKTDLIEIAESAGATFHKVNSEWRSCCPLHGGNNKNAFAVYTGADGKQRFTCFTAGCGSGDVFDFVMKWKGCNFVDAYHYLGGQDSIDPAEIARAAEIREQRAREAKEEKEREHARALADLQAARTWEAYHANLDGQSRDLWHKRGIHDAWIDWWQLGYCPNFAISADGARYVTPSLTIPIQDTTCQVINVRHRLLSPPNPNDKYRPDRPGLPAAPFIAYPGIGFDVDRVLVLEGELKAAVTFQVLWTDNVTIQVVGIPGKNQFRGIANDLKGHDVYICFDPDAGEQAREAARAVGGKVITLPVKIDDAIIDGLLSRRDLLMRLKTARKV